MRLQKETNRLLNELTTKKTQSASLYQSERDYRSSESDYNSYMQKYRK